MLNPLQGMPDALPVAADAMTSYWDELFGAVCDRLARLAEHSTESTIQAGVSECVAALTQLGVSVSQERAWHRQREWELLALRKALPKT
jgi:hypothetical protein